MNKWPWKFGHVSTDTVDDAITTYLDKAGLLTRDDDGRLHRWEATTFLARNSGERGEVTRTRKGRNRPAPRVYGEAAVPA